MCQAVFGDLSVCTEPASPCLSATCVSLYSARPTGLRWLIRQAVCWAPLRSLRYSGLIPVVLKDDWFVKQFLQPSFLAPCRASCDQLSRLSGELYVNFHNMDDECYIFSLFSFFFFYVFFFGSRFYCLDFPLLFLPLSLANPVSESLISFWRKELAYRVMICLRNSC